MTGEKLLLGLDVSTTGAKALLINAAGEVVSSATAPLALSTPRPLWSEQDPHDWWAGMSRSIREALAGAGVDGSAVAAIGLTGQMHGLVLLDERGEVLRPAILWNDQRTGPQCDEIRERVGRERLIQLTGNDALAGFTVLVPADGDGVDIQRLDTRSRVNNRQTLAAPTGHAVVDAAVVLSPGLASAGTNALVVAGRAPVLVAGDAVSYAVAGRNTTRTALSNVPVPHVVTLEVRDPSGAVVSTIVTTTTTTIPSLDAEASVTLTFIATVPAGGNGGLLVSTVAAPGAGDVRLEHGVIEPRPAGLLVTEMVVDPAQDWSDSGPSGVGGDVPFDDRPGDGAVDAGDIWVEITAPTAATADWRVVLVDANGDEFSQPFGSPVAGQRVKVLAGFGSPVLPIERVEVRDRAGATQRSYDVAAIADELGPATGPANESLTWVLDALPSAVLQQFVRRPATINQLLPF